MGTVEAIKPAGTEPFAHTLPKLLNASLICPAGTAWLENTWFNRFCLGSTGLLTL